MTVLVVGAGPTGLALACDLRSRGIEAIVFDKLTTPARTTRALGVQPRGRQILDRLGALGDLAKEALPQTGFDVFVDGHLAVRVDLASLQGRNDEGALRAPQTAVERTLRERLTELRGEVRWGHELTELRQEGPEVEASFRTDDRVRVVRGAWLVGCDGAHSLCRTFIGATFHGSTYPETYLIGDVRLDPQRDPGAAIYLRDGKILTMASLSDGVWRIGVSLPAGDPLLEKGSHALTVDRAQSATSMQEGLRRLQSLFSSYSGEVDTRLTHPSWFSVFRIHRRMASRFRQGRVLLAGDAAHLSSPLGGQGMNTGLGDAFNLGWKLALVTKGQASESLIDTYEAERRPADERIERATTQWTDVLLGEGPLNRFLRRYVALPAMRLRSVQGWVLTHRRELQSHYRGGPLAPTTHDSWFRPLLRRGPRPGDEAPDAKALSAVDLLPTSIGREIGPNWGLIFFGKGDDAVRRCLGVIRGYVGDELRVVRVAARGEGTAQFGERTLADPAGRVGRAYRAGEGTLLLLRPDGYVAWRSDTGRTEDLSRWLDGVFQMRPNPSRTAHPHVLRHDA